MNEYSGLLSLCYNHASNPKNPQFLHSYGYILI